MALVLKDRIKETSNTTGQGTLTLTGAVDGFRTFADIGNTNTTYYCITDGNNFEVGIGTYTASGTTLARTTVLQTSAGNTTKISCTGNQKVFVTQPASKAAYLDASNELVVNNTPLSTIQQRWTKTATSNQTVFSGAADSSGPTLAVNSASHVFLNGIFLKETTDYALSSGTTVTLTSGASTDDIVEVITFTPLSSGVTGISDGDIPVFTSGVADDDFLKVAGTTIEGRSVAQVLSDIGGQASLTFGIANTNAVKVDHASVADNDYAKFTSSGVEGRSYAEVLSDIGGQASLTFGISNTNAVKVDSSSVADDEYARFTANGLESRSVSEVRTDLNVADGANAYVHPNHSGEVTSTADGATVIADNIVDEANLKVSNTPTNGYVLSAQSGNTGGLTWAEAGGGMTTKISTTTISSNAYQVNFTLPTTGYTYLLVHFEGIKPTTDGTNYYIRLSDDGGSSFESIYWAKEGVSGSTTTSQSSGTTMNMNTSAISSQFECEFRGVIRINIVSDDDYGTSFDFKTGHNIQTSNQNEMNTGVGNLVGTGVKANYLRFEMAAGDISQGKFVLYGIT